MARKQVLMACGVFWPEPIVSAGLMKDLAEALAQEYDVTVVSPKPTRPMGFKVPEFSDEGYPFKIVRVNSYTSPQSALIGRFRESYSNGKAVVKYIEEHNGEFDFVYNDSWHLFGRGLITKVCKKYGIPYITPVQDIYPESITSKLPNIKPLKWLVNKTLMPLDLYCLNNAKLIHTNSEKMKQDLMTSRNLSSDKFVVVRNWQNEQDFLDYAAKKTEDKEDTPFTFMYLGNIGPLAGVDTLFDALKLAELPNARLVVAGSGSAKSSLQEKAKEYKDCNIEFWDVPAGMVPATQDKADVMCLPVKKGFAISSVPSKLPAYMFSKKPVLAAVDSMSDTAECVRLSDGGWVALPEDPQSIADCMKSAYATSKEDLQAMGKRGFDHAISRFSRGVNLKVLVDACKSVIEK